MNRFPFIAVSAFTLAFAPAVWAANNITTITPEANRVALVDGNATVRFRVSGQGSDPDHCGVYVGYGDRSPAEMRAVGREGGTFSGEFVHTFNRPGEYTVTAKGENVNQSIACGGVAVTKVSVVDEGRGRGRRYEVAAACPAGWQLREGSLDRNTGAFTCAPSYPASRMECGRGLRYFERDNTLGCAARARGRD